MGRDRGTGARKIALFALLSVGCGGAVIEPGHRGLVFDQRQGLHHDVLQPGYHRLPSGARIDDFDVTYTTKHETLHAVSSEGLPIDLTAAVISRPIVSELYLLDTEIGPSYYAEVVGPEFRSTLLAVAARWPIAALAKQNAMFENEVEIELRKRVMGKHVEVSSVLVEAVQLPPELVAAMKERVLLAEKEANAKKRAEVEAAEAERKWSKEKLELEHDAERRRLRGE